MIPALAFFPLKQSDPAFDLVVEEITGEVERLSREGRCAGEDWPVGILFPKEPN